jgi:hypothetical protein
MAGLVWVLLSTSLPDWVQGGMSWQDLIAELVAHPHNIALFGLVPLAIVFWLFASVPTSWAASFIAAAAVIVCQPVNCVINDWMVRTVLARYHLLLACGLVLCTGTASWMSVPFTLALLALAVYFYALPVQG